MSQHHPHHPAADPAHPGPGPAPTPGGPTFAPPVAPPGAPSSAPSGSVVTTGPSPYLPHPAAPRGYPVLRPRVPSAAAAAAIGVAIAYTVLRVVLAVLSVPAAAVWAEGAAQGLAYEDVEMVAYDWTAILLTPLSLAIFVAGCVWLYASRRFAEAVNPGYRFRLRPVWAWISWFVPVVCLWFPYLVLADVRRATVRGRLMAGIGAWWACWLIPGVFDQITVQLTGGWLGAAPLTPAVSAYPLFEGLAALLGCVGCWLWVAMIREVTAAQREWELTPTA